MQKLTAQDPETKSPDLAAENLAKLQALFPDLVTEGENGVAVNLDVLKALVGDKTVTDADEKYGLNWHGKRRARQLALAPSTGTLRPCPEDSVDWDTTKNLMIEGDNLEVLKLLQKSYSGKVKLIYIDPPYNTGKDFVYPDNFQDNISNYLELTGQVEGGKKISSNTEASGRFHTDWLNMMYPRLKLAKNLLKKEGVLFVSIGEHEVSNLKKMCDEVMGEENFIGLVSRSQKGGGNKGIHYNPVVDYILCYATSIESLESFTEHIDPKIYNKTETSGPRAGDKFAEVVIYMPNLDPMRGCKNQRYYIQCPDGSFVIPPGDVFPESVGEGIGIPPKTGRDKVWRWIYETYKKNLDEGRVAFKRSNKSKLVKADGTQADWIIYQKRFYNDSIENEMARPNNLFLDFQNMIGSKELSELNIPFDYPKPSLLIKHLLFISKTRNDDIILDFFAGSCTTSHAVMAMNAEDNNNRRYIVVQMPEPCETNSDALNAGFKTIADIGKERLRRAGKKIRGEWEAKHSSHEATKTRRKEEQVGQLFSESESLRGFVASCEPSSPPDLGFRVFKLASSNIREWDPNRENLAESLEASIEHLKTDRSEQDILFELLLKLGLDLCVPIETHKIGGHEVRSIGGGSLLVCLSTKIPQKEVESLALGIVKWHQSLKPAGETTVVFRDSAFTDDVAKSNLTAILHQHGLETVRSL